MQKKILGLVASLIVAGCGSNASVQDFSGVPQSSGATAPQLLALVRSAQGAPVGGVRVVAQDRTTSWQVEGISGADGSVFLDLPAGAYDVGLDNEGDLGTATCFYGPVVVTGKTQREFILRSSEGRPPGQIFGELSLTPGVKTALRQLTVRPGAAKNLPAGVDGKSPLTTTTDAQGRFALTLPAGSEFALDLDVFDGANQLDEFIDISKREKPCYVEFTTEEIPVENALRCNQAPVAPTSKAAGLAGAAKPVNQKFTRCFIDPPNNGTMVMDGGNLPPGGDQSLLRDLVPSIPSDSNFSKLIGLMSNPEGTDCSIRVDTDHAWYWGTYAVHVNPDRASNFVFFDDTGDQYSLWISDVFPTRLGAWHRVSYNSSKPSINKVTYHL